MKAIAKNFGRLIMIATIPVMLMASCEGDLVEPEKAHPKSKRMLPVQQK